MADIDFRIPGNSAPAKREGAVDATSYRDRKRLCLLRLLQLPLHALEVVRKVGRLLLRRALLPGPVARAGERRGDEQRRDRKRDEQRPDHRNLLASAPPAPTGRMLGATFPAG